jgi:hypothetical protein
MDASNVIFHLELHVTRLQTERSYCVLPVCRDHSFFLSSSLPVCRACDAGSITEAPATGSWEVTDEAEGARGTLALSEQQDPFEEQLGRSLAAAPQQGCWCCGKWLLGGLGSCEWKPQLQWKAWGAAAAAKLRGRQMLTPALLMALVLFVAVVPAWVVKQQRVDSKVNRPRGSCETRHMHSGRCRVGPQCSSVSCVTRCVSHT